MKLTAVLYVLALSPCAIAAPTFMVPGKVPGRADLFDSGLRQETRISAPIKTLPQLPNKASGKKGSKTHHIHLTNKEPHVLSNGGTSSSSLPKETSHESNSSYLASLAHRLTNKSPFSESSIVREETRASTGDWEREPSIVEWETKASREAYIWIPCFSSDKSLGYHRIRVNTDMLVVSLVLSLTAIVIIIELWKPVATRLRSFQSGHGPIYLDNNEVTSDKNSAQESYTLYRPMPEPDVETQQEPGKAEVVTPK